MSLQTMKLAKQAEKALRLLDLSYRLRVASDPVTHEPTCFMIENSKGAVLWAGPKPPTIEEIGAL
jgi:hypothetical protein